MSPRDVKIFLVEDDLSFGSVLKSYLEINEFTVEWVDDGKYAIDHFSKEVIGNQLFTVYMNAVGR